MIKSPDTELILKNLKVFRDIPVINNLFFIMGAGKFGKIALNYAIKQGNSTIIIIDEKIDAAIDIKAKKIENIKEFLEIYQKIIDRSIKKSPNKDQKIYFFQGGLDLLSLLFTFGIPELFIPVIPVHIMGKLVLNYLSIYFNGKKIVKTQIEDDYFSEVIKEIPAEIFLTEERTSGLITLSYAKLDETCPSNCIGKEGYCSHFKRSKPETVTKIIQNLSKSGLKGWVIESHQIRAGLGALYGAEIKNLLMDILEYADITRKSRVNSNELRNFGISTTCNCHGVLNLFSLDD
jgi:hypothetical protein